MSEKNTLETILKWTVVVIVALVAIRVVLTLLGIAFVIAGWLWKLLPLVLLAWAVVKLVQWLGGNGKAGQESMDL